MTTILEAKEQLRKNFEKGAICPCCNQLVKLYKFAINSSMSKNLLALDHFQQGEDYLTIDELVSLTNDAMFKAGNFPKLRWWGLIERPANDDPDKRSSGMWRITEKGRAFVKGRITVPKKALLYNQKCWGFEGDQVSIKDSLGEFFSYRDLMDS